MKTFLLKLLTIIFVLTLCLGIFTACGGNVPEHKCVFDKKIVENKYLKSEATCENKAIYYYSCNCGEKGSLTFEHSEPLGHDFANYVYNNDAICEVDGTETATCENGCGSNDTKTKENTALEHNYGNFISNNDGTHTKTCKNNSEHKITEDCSGGVATETNRPICSVCNEEYGMELGHQHNYNVKDSTSKYLKTEATCENKAVYYYSCKCSLKSTLTYEVGEPLGHDYDDWVHYGNNSHAKICKNDNNHKIIEQCKFDETKPMCKGDNVCLDCNYSYPAKNHRLNDEEIDYNKVYDWTIYEEKGFIGLENVEKICNAGIFNAYFDCTTCKKLILIQAVVPHTKPSSGVVVIPATCTVNGSESYKCVSCKENIVEILNAGHKYVYSVTATNKDGTINILGNCSRNCGTTHPIYNATATYKKVDSTCVEQGEESWTIAKIDGVFLYNPLVLKNLIEPKNHRTANNIILEEGKVYDFDDNLFHLFGNSNITCKDTGCEAWVECIDCEQPLQTKVKLPHKPTYDIETLIKPTTNGTGYVEVICAYDGCGINMGNVIIPKLSQAKMQGSTSATNYTYVIENNVFKYTYVDEKYGKITFEISI